MIKHSTRFFGEICGHSFLGKREKVHGRRTHSNRTNMLLEQNADKALKIVFVPRVWTKHLKKPSPWEVVRPVFSFRPLAIAVASSHDIAPYPRIVSMAVHSSRGVKANLPIQGSSSSSCWTSCPLLDASRCRLVPWLRTRPEFGLRAGISEPLISCSEVTELRILLLLRAGVLLIFDRIVAFSSG